MKLEPLKLTNLPKYAAVLAFAASAAVLTGCSPLQTGGDVAIEVTAPETDIAASTVPETDIAAATLPEEDESPALEGGIDIREDSEVRPEGDDAAEPLMLEGDVVWIPDYQEALDRLETALDDTHLQIYMDAFAAAGMPMTRISVPFTHYGSRMTAALENQERSIGVAFFDGTAEDQGVNMFDYLTKNQCGCGYDWGCVLKNINYKDRFSMMVFVDISKESEDVAAYAAQIAKDVIQ